ncbi:major facilitator family transporter [Legionella lansingensis]|uniref:Major facilitator family transporter n=1 Tax=Legionella lansingensis TaxID=45067 RepID=A0A0W0VTD9_9GAMM|nr:MFS transporter [Legionella lansingensis]KTD23456.1 major facilitator family transporter [Legionella lansingensis]SNV50851.1 major facilitator family transporter [Legionella lansingensis]
MHKYRNITACIIGNALEWYEFSLFAYLSPVIASLFFPNANKIASLLATLLVFAAGFVVRPLGSIVLGHLGDQFGRAKTLKFTILLMSISSVLTGFLPTYQQAGLLAPVLLIICRLLQGFCIGGEFAGSMIYLSESADAKHRAFVSSMTNNGSNIGVLTAIVACTIFSNLFGNDLLSAYGWRILFISGGFLGIIGLWLRRDLSESDIFLQLQENIKERYLPIKYVLTHQLHRVIHIILLLFISACGSYTLMGYLSTYLHEFLHIPLNQAYQIQTLFIVFTLLFVPLFAYISDKVGRKNVLLFSIVGYLIFALPSFWLLQHIPAWWVLVPLIIFYSAEQAVTPVVMAEMFSGKGRYTGISIAYNICMALVGGFSPAINTWLINRFNTMMIAYYVIFCALVSLLIVLKRLPKEYGLESNLATA